MQRARRELSRGAGASGGALFESTTSNTAATTSHVTATTTNNAIGSPSASSTTASSAASSAAVTGAVAFPSLWHVKGAREPFLIRPVAPVSQSINSGDTFVLHSPVSLTVWLGAQSCQAERVRGVYLALELQSSVATQASVKPEIVIVDEAQTPAEFWHALSGSNVIRSAAAGGDDKDLRFSHALYGVKDHKFVEVLRGALPDRSLLHSAGVFVLESDDGVSVWCGRHAPASFRTQALAIAEQLTSKHSLVAPSVELEGHESVRFRTQVLGFTNSARLSEAKKLLNSGKLAWRVNTLHVQPARVNNNESYADGVISSIAPRREALQSALIAKLAATQLNVIDEGSEENTSDTSDGRSERAAVDDDNGAVRLDSLDAFDVGYRYSVRVTGAGVLGATSGRGEAVLDATVVCAERLTFGAQSIFLEAKSKGLLQAVGGDGVVKTMSVEELTRERRWRPAK